MCERVEVFRQRSERERMRSRRVEITLPPRATERSIEAVVRGYGSVEVRLAAALPRPGISTPPHQRGCRRRSTG